MGMDFSIIAALGLNSTKFERGVTKARGIVNKLGKGLLALGGLGGTAGLLKVGTDALRMASDLENASAKLGLTTDLLQELGFAGEQFGVRQDTTNMALQRFTRRVGEAQQGTGELLPVLEKYNIALRNSNGTASSAEEILRDYADTVRRAESDQERLRLAFKAFDSEGAALVPVLADGAAGLDAFAEQARAAGAVMSEETIAGLGRAEQAITDWKRRITVAVGNILVDFDSKAGLKNLGLQLLREAARFGGGVLDALVQAHDIGRALFRGTFTGLANHLRDGLITGLQKVVEVANKLPFVQIDVSKLEVLKSTGEGIAQSIRRAIANTSPTTFKHDFANFWDDAVAKQSALLSEQRAQSEVQHTRAKQVAIENHRTTLQAYDEARRQIVAASETTNDSIKDGADALRDAGRQVQDNIETGAERLHKARTSGFSVHGRHDEELSDAELEEKIRNLNAELARQQVDATRATFFSITNPFTAMTRGQLEEAESELQARRRFRSSVAAFGESGAARFYNVSEFERLLQFVSSSPTAEKSLETLQSIESDLRFITRGGRRP